MKLNRIVINNFRCYYGENEMIFNSDGKITLIYGDSGYGKSSFLQFFRWMFYNNPDFGKHDDMPLFNTEAFKDIKLNDYIEVSGLIEFEHLGIKYSLIRSKKYKVGLTIKTTMAQVTSDLRLSVLNNDNWEPYLGDIPNKINSILPSGLANYFLLDGEKARDIVLDSKNIKLAIYSLFGLDAYDKAIKHLGSDHTKKSVIGHYYSLMTAEMKSTTAKMSAAQMQEALEELDEEIEKLKEDRRNTNEQLSEYDVRRAEIFKMLGGINNKNHIEQIIQSNQKTINENKVRIKNLEKRIGDLFYQNYPYLFLSRITSKTASILREKNQAFALNYKNIFENLKKELLKEIIEKKVCVCGRSLDEESIEHINGVINVMPPDSYTYQFGQFVTKSKNDLYKAKIDILDYGKILNTISRYEVENARLEDDIQEKKDILRHLDEAKNLIDELDQVELNIKKLSSRRDFLNGEIAKKKQTYDLASRQLNTLIKNDKVSAEYTGKIAFLKSVLENLKTKKAELEKQIKLVLNNCVREIFRQLSTQTELDVDKIQFINDDFSLRTTYLSGGQLAVDEYAYVIGIIKSLQEFKLENNENPIIIDAPFAFTGNAQSEHIFKTLPTVVKQTILLTLDLNKIKNLLISSNNYDFYVIKNETQSKARIERGDINAIKF